MVILPATHEQQRFERPLALVEQSAGPAEFRSEVYKRAVEAYSWDHITALYDKIFGRDDGETMNVQLEARRLRVMKKKG